MPVEKSMGSEEVLKDGHHQAQFFFPDSAHDQRGEERQSPKGPFHWINHVWDVRETYEIVEYPRPKGKTPEDKDLRGVVESWGEDSIQRQKTIDKFGKEKERGCMFGAPGNKQHQDQR